MVWRKVETERQSSA